MGQDRKKKNKRIANRVKQNKYTARYGVFNTPSKFIEKNPQNNVEQTNVEQNAVPNEERAPELNNVEPVSNVPQSQQIFNGLPPQPRGPILTKEEMEKFPRTDKQPNVVQKPATQSVGEFVREFEQRHNITRINNNEQIRPRDKHAEIQQFIQSTPVKKTGQTADNINYEIEETFVIRENDRVNTHTVKVSDYNSHITKKLKTEIVTQKLRTDLQDILVAADFKGRPVADIVYDLHSRFSKISVSDGSINGPEANMHDMAMKFFNESYEAIGKADLTPKNRIIAAQNIADLMIRNYSPIAFVNVDEDLEQYIDKYVMKDTSLLRTQLESFNAPNVDKLIEEIDAAFENDFEYDKYEISENESVNTHTLNMPTYNILWINQVEKSNVTQSIRSELNSILKAAGINKEAAFALADEIHGPLSQTVAYDNSIDRNSINMRDVAARFFRDSYAAIDKSNLSPRNRIIAAQNIADLMIRNYSPIAFAKREELSQYADKYVVQNKTLLRGQLETLNVQNVDKLLSDVDLALENGFEYDQSAPIVPDPEPNVNSGQRVEEPVENLVKPIIPDFYQKLGKRMDSKDVTDRALLDIKYIIKEAGVADWDRATAISDASYSFVRNQINSIYNKETVTETKMSKDASTFFRSAFASLYGFGLGTKEQIIAAQKIANVMIANYSPVTFIEEGLEQYATDYVLNNREVFKAQLDMLRLFNTEALMDDVYAARGVYSEEETYTEFEKWLNYRRESDAVSGVVYNDLIEILTNAGYTDQHDAAELVRYIQRYGSRTIIDNPNLDGDNPNMHDIAMQFFEDSYVLIEPAGLSQKDAIITAQKVADVLLKNYSHAADEKDFEQYANNYVLGNTAFLRSVLEKFQVQNIDTLLADGDIKNAAGSGSRIPDMVNGARLREDPTGYIYDRARDGRVADEITGILVDAGVSKYVAEDLKVADILEDAYSSKNIPTDSVSMRDIAKHIFVSTYKDLTKREMAPNDKIGTVQKIADLILKNYSPVIRNRALKQYADNYVVNDSELLKETLTVLNVSENGQVIEDGEKKENVVAPVVNQNENNVQENEIDPAPAQNPAPKHDLDTIDGVQFHSTYLNVFVNVAKTSTKVKNSVSTILKAAGVEQDKVNTLALDEIVKDAYSPEKVPKAPVLMRDVAKHVFMSTYDALTKKGISPNDKIETTQKIADELLKSFSPIMYMHGTLDKYAESYVTGDKQLLQECLTALNSPQNESKEITENKNPKPSQRKAAPKTYDEKIRHYFGNSEQSEKYIQAHNEARVAVFTEKLKAFNNMYKVDVDSNAFASSVTEAWSLMTGDDKQKAISGREVLYNVFKDTLKKAFDVEKNASYNEHRLPEYVEITKSANELLRAAMYGLTDMYHNPDRKGLFEATAFGGLDAKDMGDLTAGESIWEKDQKSDEAWDIQAQEAKGIADKWLKEDKPYEKMISEMKALITANKEGIVSRKETLDKLTAAEWLLINNDKMTVEDPEDPFNRLPNWGNRYWKALTETREALGVDKYTSMRTMIQNDYEAMAKTVSSAYYNKTQIQLYVLDKDVRELSDSMEAQREQFTTQQRDVVIKNPQNEKKDEHKDEIRWQEPVESENERKKMKNEPKVFSNMVVDKQKDLKIDSVK